MNPDAAQFSQELYPALVMTLTAHAGNRADAEDLAQEALTRAVTNWRKVRSMEHPEAWVYRVAFNLSASRWRRLGAERRALARLPADEPLEPEPQPWDERQLVRDAVGALPPRQRAAVTLRFLTDMSIAETAVALDCRAGTVKSLTSQGIAALRSQLGDLLAPDLASRDTDHG